MGYNSGSLEAHTLVSKGHVLHGSFLLEFRVTSSSTGRKVIVARGKEWEDTCYSGAIAPGKVLRLWNSSVCGSDRNLYVWPSD